MSEAVIFELFKYMDEHLFEPKANWPKDIFYHRSCERWAVNEIIERLIDKPLSLPESVMEEFILDMTFYRYSNGCTNVNAVIFSIAIDTIEEALNHLRLTGYI